MLSPVSTPLRKPGIIAAVRARFRARFENGNMSIVDGFDLVSPTKKERKHTFV